MVAGWVERPLGEVFTFTGGVSASRAQLSNVGFPYLHYGDIHGTTHTFIDVCADGTIPRLNVSLSKISNASLLQDGDVVFVDASEDDEGASRHIVVRNAENKPFISGLHTIIAKPKTDDLDNRYREHCFQTTAIKTQFRFYAVGTKVIGVNKSTIKDISLCFPVDIREQHRIAAALSDTDEYITALEKLIAKKRAVKQGVMQELLTGKRRLPGFNGKWVNKPFGELFDFSGGLSASRVQLSNIGYPYLHYGDIHGTERTFIDVCSDNTIPRLNISLNKVSCASLLQDGDVVFVDASEDDEGASRHLAVRNSENKPFISGLHTIVAKAKTTELNNRYKEHCFKTAEIRSQYRFYAVGTKVVGVNKSSIKEISLYFPSDIIEQTAIAAILSDMDAEIEALKAKLEKMRHIKQGMMSELLTGRIRLVEAEQRSNIIQMPEQKAYYGTHIERPLLVAEKEGLPREGVLEYIYIDDSGDAGIEKSNTDQLVIAAVVVADEAIKNSLTDAINRFRRDLGWNELDEFKFSKMNKETLVKLISFIRDYDYKAYVVVLDKKKIDKGYTVEGSIPIFNFTLKELLKRVGKNKQMITVDGKFSKKKATEVRAYLRQHLRKAGIVDAKIMFSDSRKEPLIQLADIVAGAIARSYKDKPDAQRYLELLKSKIIMIDSIEL